MPNPKDGLATPPSGDQVQGAEAIAEAVRRLFRTLRTLRSYPIDNEISVRALGEFTPRLAQALPFSLELGAQEFRWGDTPLKDDRGAFPPLMADLYRDGIRRIQLEPGLAEEELRRFLLTLASPLDASDLTEDYVTRLWEADVPHVRVFAVDPYLDVETPEEVLEGHVPRGSHAEELAPAPELKIPPPPESAFQIAPEDEARVAQEMKRAATSRPWGAFVDALFDSVTAPMQEEQRENLVEIFEAYFFRLVREHQVDVAARVLEQLRGPSASAAASLFGPSVARIAQADRLVALHEALEARTASAKDAVSLLVVLGPDSLDAVCTFLEQTTSERLRRLYADVLLRMGGPASPRVIERFRSASGDARRTYARALGGLEGEAVVTTLLDARSEPDAGIRREVVRALATHHDARAGGALLRIALEDTEPESRIIALRGLEGTRTRLNYQNLLQRIQSRQYRSLASEEKDLLFRVLGTIGDDDVVPLLQKILRHSWIPGRTHRDDWPRAASGLARLGTPSALVVLEAASGPGTRQSAPRWAASSRRPGGQAPSAGSPSWSYRTICS